MSICGAILAGGQSRRFGSTKADAEIDGKRLIIWVADALEPQVDTLIICGREEPLYTCCKDLPEAGIGPLGGLLSALKFASENGHETVVSTGCDAPDLPKDLVQQLMGHGAAIVENQPVVGLWPTDLAATLETFVADGGRSLYGFAEHIDARRTTLKQPMANINSPEDLKSL